MENYTFTNYLINKCKDEIKRLEEIIPLSHPNDKRSVRGKLGFQRRLLKYLNS